MVLATFSKRCRARMDNQKMHQRVFKPAGVIVQNTIFWISRPSRRAFNFFCRQYFAVRRRFTVALLSPFERVGLESRAVEAVSQLAKGKRSKLGLTTD